MGTFFGVIFFLIGSGMLSWGLVRTFDPWASGWATAGWIGFGLFLCAVGYLMKELSEISQGTSRALDKFFGAILFLIGLGTLVGSLCIGTIEGFTLLKILRIIASIVFCGIGYFFVTFKPQEL
jgi:hypothetical protein